MKDNTALITGGAGHIGGEICRRLGAAGVNIAVLDKDAEAGEALAAQLSSEFGTDNFFLEANLIDPSVFAAIRREVESRFGRLDYIVNNAAFYDDMPGWGVPYEEEGYEAWLKVMQVNLLAPFFLVQALTPLLEESKAASVVNVSSIYGVSGPDLRLYEGTEMTNPAAYAASKGGLIQLGRWLSTVLAPVVRVNTVTPGGVARGQDKGFVKRYKERTPLGRMATESDVAGAVFFLLSPDAGYITGQNIIVDGGWTAW